MKKAHRSEFLKAMKQLFPEIRNAINKEQGLLTFELEVIMKHIQTLINNGNKELVIHAYIELNRCYQQGNKALSQSIRNAVCEDLDLSNTESMQRHWAFEVLPNPLKSERIAWFKFMGYKPE